MDDLRLTEEEIREHYPDEDIDTVLDILTRFNLVVGNWYRYADIKHFGDVFPRKHSDYAMDVLGLEEYPPLYFRYDGGTRPWSQATDNRIMYIDRYKYMCYHEEEYAEHGLEWLDGAENQITEIENLINRQWRDIEENDYRTIDCLNEIIDEISYRKMCYDTARRHILQDMEESANRQKTHVSSMFGKMLTPNTVIDGRDKTPCMYDFAEDILNGDEMIAICKRNHNDEKENSKDCKDCTEPCCSWSGVNNV